jgi:hypothetical protein
MPWIGKKKLALVPLYRSNAHPPDQIPDDWYMLLMQRLFYDPDPRTGADRSLRTYIHTVSSGLADFDAFIAPMQTIDAQDVPPNALDGAPFDFGLTLGEYLRGAQVRADAAALVMLGGVGAGTSAGFWCRFVMAEGVGVWAMEFMHSLTAFGDLYPFGGNMGAFDEMACSCGTHPSAFTKRAIQWLDPSAVARVTLPNEGFELHSVGLVQPPPHDSRVTAVQVGSTVPYYMVEARKKVDQFDAGIPSEGVIVYRIQTTDPLGHAQNATAPIQLMTPTALTPGQDFVTDTGMSIKVDYAAPGAFGVIIGQLPWRSVSQGSTTPGGLITAVRWGQQLALFVANPVVYTTGGDPQGGFGPWASVSDGFVSVPGAPVTAVPWGSRFALFAADSNGAVCTAGGDPQNGLMGAWAAISDGFVTVPGAPVTAIPWGQRFALFAADSNGGIFTAAGDPQNGLLGPWASVSDGKSTPGAFVGAVAQGQGFALFVADQSGAIYTTKGDPQAGFGPWSLLPGITAKPGSPVTAVSYGQGIAKFVANTSGEIYTATNLT